MRDLRKYEDFFLKDSFERYQEVFRRKKIKSMIERFYTGTENFHVLEIGCGVKPLFLDYDDNISFTVVEPSDKMFENAEQLSCKYNHAKCYHGLFEDVWKELLGIKYDLIICASLLQELEKPQELLADINEVCDEYTVVHINVPNAYSFHRLLAKEMNIIESVYEFSDLNKCLQQNRVFDVDSLKNVIQDSGGEIIDSGSLFLKPFTHSQMQKCMQNGIINEEILEGLDRICETYFGDYGSEIFVNYRKKSK